MVPERLEQTLHVLGRRRLPLEASAGRGVSQLEKRRVQRLPWKCAQRCGQLRRASGRDASATPIYRVADDRKADMREVHADQERAAGLELDARQRVRPEALHDTIPR